MLTETQKNNLNFASDEWGELGELVKALLDENERQAERIRELEEGIRSQVIGRADAYRHLPENKKCFSEAEMMVGDIRCRAVKLLQKGER